MKQKAKSISLIIPVWNEANRLPLTFQAIAKWQLPDGFKLKEIIFVNDGSTDNSLGMIKAYKSSVPVKIISYRLNKGKGYAVRQGFRKASADYILLSDADMSAPLSEFRKLANKISAGVDIVVGTRKNGHSTVLVHQSFIRENLGKIYTKLTRLILGLPITDFTCGFKLFSRQAVKEIVKYTAVDRWSYDAEIIYIAHRLGFQIAEAPVTWSNYSGTKVKLFKDAIQSLYDLIKIRRRLSSLTRIDLRLKEFSKPLVSVVIPAYNCQTFIKACLESVYKQTYQNFELIVVNDTSSDKTGSVLFSVKRQHPGLKILTNSQNLGVAQSFNRGVSVAQGKYIARMDADDLMNPNRLELQINYLQAYPRTVIVGGQCTLIDEQDQVIGKKTFPLSNQEIKKMLFESVPMQQPSIMINRQLLPKDFIFARKRYSPAEDYDLFFRASHYGDFGNLPHTILLYREHKTNISLVKPKATFWKICLARLEAVRNLDYFPQVTSLGIVFAQVMAMLFLPEKVIYPLHKLVRQMH